MLLVPLPFLSAAPAISSFILRASATAIDTGTITVPAIAVAGDLAVLFHCAYCTTDNSSGLPSDDANPSGWSGPTGNHDATGGTNLEAAAVRANYKRLTAPDLGASVTVMTANGSPPEDVSVIFNRAIMLVFSPGIAGTPTYTPGTFNADVNTGNPGAQTVTHSASVPQIMVGFVCGPSGSTGAFSTASPAWDGTVAAGSEAIAGYKLYPTGSSPADHTVDMNDLGLANFLASGRFVVS